MNTRHNPSTRVPYLDNPKSIIRAANAAKRQAAAARSRAQLRACVQIGQLPPLPVSPPPTSTTPLGSPPATPVDTELPEPPHYLSQPPLRPLPTVWSIRPHRQIRKAPADNLG
jgi:hypothetical protein